uniref:EF-hand domain-containing protein n=1 Tax=Biomphalaria glabrata TaxID=6526 RepID=A0A2C9LCK9_BIOGL
MDQKERLNKMAHLVFNKTNLGQLKDGLCVFLDLYSDVLNKEFENGTSFSHDEILGRLDKIDLEIWRPIRNVFLCDPYYGYMDGNFSEDEKMSPAKLMLDWLNVFDHINIELRRKLETYDNIVGQLNREKNALENSLSKTEALLREERTFKNGERTQLKTAQSSVTYLETVLREKNEKIAELQKEKNVQLWEREKERIFAESDKRLRILEQELADQKHQNESLTKRLKQIDDNNKILKLRHELAMGTFSTGSKSTEELKRNIYLLEKDVLFLEDQLYNLQRTFATVICGLKTDLLILGKNRTDPLSGQKTDLEFINVCDFVSLIYKSLMEGDLTEAQRSLPPHYSYLPNDFKIRRIRRVSRPKTTVHADDNDDSSLPPLRPSGPVLDKSSSSQQEVRNVDILGSIEDAPVVENPCLVDPIDRQINTTACMRYFPHMSMDFIKDHWERFQEFDVDGNESLDFTEVVKALTSMGLQFTAQQAEEAMRESDINKNRTLDFYEYLLVADKLFSKKGRSELFHTGAAKDNRKVIAKTCSVQ